MNDPNGLCYFNGRYHVFYQYNSQWPDASQKAWGEFVSDDLLSWEYMGMPLEPRLPQDRHGVYSGSSVVVGDLLRVYYTGNVINKANGHNPKDVSFLYDSREAYQLMAESSDGIHFGERQVLLGPADYPAWCSAHVRDPFVWRQDGAWYMLLGARHVAGYGLCLLYESADGIAWSYMREITSPYAFGYMWECPNLVRLGSHDFLAFCPQGLPRTHDRWQSIWQAGYVRLDGSILTTDTIDERDFVEWDVGHDFYAPQVFVDPKGRTILIGWLGTFDRTQEVAPDGLSWAHCLTVPRVLTLADDGRTICQWPVAELEDLRGAAQALGRTRPVEVIGRQADIELSGIGSEGELVLDGSLTLSWEAGRLRVAYLDDTGRGRMDRTWPCERLNNLRVLVDGSVVEYYANDGDLVGSSRWFCKDAQTLSLTCTFEVVSGTVWPMEDRMSAMYETAVAPDIRLKGYNVR